jgi:proliferating cell nuclear antigen
MTSFKAQLKDPMVFKSLMSGVASLVEEGDFTVTSKGIELRALDPSHIAMVDFKLSRDAFATFEEGNETGRDIKIRIVMQNLLKILKNVSPLERLQIIYDGDTKKLVVQLISKVLRRFTIPTLESSTEAIPDPNVVYDSMVKLDTLQLKKAIDDAQIMADNVNLSVNEGGFFVKARGETSMAEVEMPKEAVIEMTSVKPTAATYNLNYLSEIVGGAIGASNTVLLNFSTASPVKITFEMKDDNRLMYYLAPRIDSS